MTLPAEGFLILMILFMAPPLPAEEAKTNQFSRLDLISPCSELVNLARAKHISLTGFSPLVEASSINPMILQLNHHPALKLTLVVTAPYPPLLATAGIIAILAEKPDNPEIFLTLHLLSASHAVSQP